MITPEPFLGKQSWEDWIDQFKSIAAINGWSDEQKLVWLKVRLTGRALLAYKKFSVTARSSFKNAVVALAERFEPESRRDLYLAKFQSRCKKRTKSWAYFGEDLRVLVDKAYPMLEDDTRQQLALQRYLSQLCNDQVAFGVKQRKPKTIDSSGGYFRIGVIFGATQFIRYGCSSTGGLCGSKEQQSDGYDVSIAYTDGEAGDEDTI